MDKIEQVREQIRANIYSEITPVSGVGGAQLIYAIDRMVDRILQIPFNGVTIEEVIKRYESSGSV